MTHQELADAIPLYVLGALERGERQTLDAHFLSGCASCHALLREFQAVAAALPFSLDLVPPPRLLRAAIMSAPPSKTTLDTQQDIPRLEPGKWMEHVLRPQTASPPVAVKALAGLVIIATIAASLYLAQPARQPNKPDNQNTSPPWNAQEAASHLAELERELDDRERLLNQTREELRLRLAEIAELKDQLIQREAELDVLTAQLQQQGKQEARSAIDDFGALLRTPQVQAVILAGTPTAAQASGILLYNHRSAKIWLYTLNLPDCPPGMEYRLWVTRGTQPPVPIGAFRIGKGETAHLFVTSAQTMHGVTAFSVTLEPVGTTSQPTGTPYLLSRV
jgi:anti-sigma-K factor RskA